MALKFNVEGRDIGSVINEAQARRSRRKVKPPDGHYFVWGGEFENQQRAMARLRVVVPIALLVVLVLLYSALGSARSALAVIATAPFALTGGVFALLLAGIPLSVSAAVGFIALLGQVSLAGLLVVVGDRERGAAKAQPLADALVDGPTARFRALLMAALLAILGLLPMALSHAVGSETQRPFAVVIIGGMVTTLLVALVVLPVFYQLITRKGLGTPVGGRVVKAVRVIVVRVLRSRRAACAHAQPAEVTADQAVALYRERSPRLAASRARDRRHRRRSRRRAASIRTRRCRSARRTSSQGQDTFGHSQETVGARRADPDRPPARPPRATPPSARIADEARRGRRRSGHGRARDPPPVRSRCSPRSSKVDRARRPRSTTPRRCA